LDHLDYFNKEDLSSAKKLLLDNVPPPPSSQPPQIEELTNALEKQLSEIEKHVKSKQSAMNPIQNSTAATSSVNSKNLFSPSSSSSSSSSNNKFGNSMREMLKNVVSSQKNVKTKKVEPIESTQKSKVGKFFQNLTKNSLSKSNQSLTTSKDSLNSTETRPNHGQSSHPQDLKKRSKSLSSETRTPLSSTKSRSEMSSSSAGKNAHLRANADLGSSSSAKTNTRWLGKNPFETDKSPATEAYPKSQLQASHGPASQVTSQPQQQTTWLGRGRVAHKEALKKRVQKWETSK